jgi:hypothetical protein
MAAFWRSMPGRTLHALPEGQYEVKLEVLQVSAYGIRFLLDSHRIGFALFGWFSAVLFHFELGQAGSRPGSRDTFWHSPQKGIQKSLAPLCAFI